MTSLKTYCKVFLWVALVLLTLSLLNFPIKLRFEYHIVESLFAFGNLLFLFAFLYVIWIILLFIASLIGNYLENFVIVGMFNLVFSGLWINAFHVNLIDQYSLGGMKCIIENGFIPFENWNLFYIDFPGLDLLAAFLNLILKIDPYSLKDFFMLFYAFIFPELLYIFYTKLLGNYRFAVLTTIILLHSNWMLTRASIIPGMCFWGGILSFLLMTCFLIVLLQEKKLERSILLTVIMFTITITYLPTSIFIFLMLLSICLFQRKLREKAFINSLLLIIHLLIIFAWVFYIASRTQLFLVDCMRSVGEYDIMERILNYLHVSRVEESPLWVNAIQFFWITFALIFGVLIFFWKITFSLKKNVTILNRTDTIIYCGITASLLITVLMFLIMLGGLSHNRLQMFGTFFTTPMVIKYLLDLKKPLYIRKFCILLFILIILLSLPTFIANNKRILSWPIYTYEHSSAMFLQHTLKDVRHIKLFSSLWYKYGFNQYYFPLAKYETESEWQYFDLTKSAQDLMVFWKTLVLKFSSEKFEESNLKSIFIYSQRLKVNAKIFYNIEFDDPCWNEVVDELLKNQKVYDNGYVTLFTSL